VTSDLDDRVSNQPPPLALDVLRTLRSNRAALEQIGVRHVSLFGSVARGEEGPDSDVDLLIETDPDVVDNLFALSCVHRTLQDLVPREIDVALLENIQPDVFEAFQRDNIRAF
jgi:predicted nucleotidyltransferase